jgi:copper chaperone CopZ
MKSLSKTVMVITLLLSVTLCYAQSNSTQIKNAKTETVKIYGNCGMCEKTIGKAGNLKKVATVDWNKDTKMATLTYDAKKTNQSEILKRIALAGYDSDSFIAPDDVYASLMECCQYDRNPLVNNVMVEEPKMESTDHSAHKMPMETQEVDQMASVFDNYFAVKDALVETNGAVAAVKSNSLLTAIKAVNMNKLPMDVHMVWMKVFKELQESAEQIADSIDISSQRDQFIGLSKNMYALMKAAKYEQPIYYQFCPMANGGKGANWLSKDNEVKNPYYGSQMLSCGKTVETIK